MVLDAAAKGTKGASRRDPQALRRATRRRVRLMPPRPSPSAGPAKKSSRCSGFRRKLAFGTTRGVMARSRSTILPASSSRPICGVAGGQVAIRLWVAWILLDREKQLRHCLIEAPGAEMRSAHCSERYADTGARARNADRARSPVQIDGAPREFASPISILHERADRDHRRSDHWWDGRPNARSPQLATPVR
jgi:hypothetical protein